MANRKTSVAREKPEPKGIEAKVRLLARQFGERLKWAIDQRLEEMKGDDRSHFLIYQVLGVGNHEGLLVDEYQNKGRFLYKYAGSFLEEAAKLCYLRNSRTRGRFGFPIPKGDDPRPLKSIA